MVRVADLERVARVTDRIRTYSAVENRAVAALARDQGVRVTLGAWLDRRTDNNDIQVAAAVRTARDAPNVERIIVGNEAVLRGDLTVDELITYLKRIRRFTKKPVSTAEPWHVWLRYPELARHVDFITVHLLPYWEGVPAEHAVDYALTRYNELQRAFPKKRVVIGEIGWPSRGDRVGGAIASPAEQARFVREFLARTAEQPLDYFLEPVGVAVDTDGYVYVADAWQSVILKYDPSGNFIAAWEDTPDENGGMFSFRPTYLALDSAANVFATDYYNNRVYKFDATGALIDNWGDKGSGPGEFSYPSGIAVDASDHVFVADTFNHRIQQFDTAGTFIAEWGSEGTGDGLFNLPFGVAAASSGTIYVADTFNHRIQLFDFSDKPCMVTSIFGDTDVYTKNERCP